LLYLRKGSLPAGRQEFPLATPVRT